MPNNDNKNSLRIVIYHQREITPIVQGHQHYMFSPTSAFFCVRKVNVAYILPYLT